jgi:hypothetical protein
MGPLKCPSCGSSDLSLLSPDEYKCPICSVSFRLAHAQTGFVDVVPGRQKADRRGPGPQGSHNQGDQPSDA